MAPFWQAQQRFIRQFAAKVYVAACADIQIRHHLLLCRRSRWGKLLGAEGVTQRRNLLSQLPHFQFQRVYALLRWCGCKGCADYFSK